jgi:hypothetical protein
LIEHGGASCAADCVLCDQRCAGLPAPLAFSFNEGWAKIDLRGTLTGKDLMVVRFWTDWAISTM